MPAACNTAETFKVTRPKGGFSGNMLLFIDLSSLGGKLYEISRLGVKYFKE
jgi:hypothetical protein